ncbi:hypothetical protein [Phenylobacterium sp.]|nr:hypothetical protein [Phenylobacterium sp.]
MRSSASVQDCEAVMAAQAVMFVSKRLQRVVFALMCLMTAQLILTMASCEPDEPALLGAVRVPISYPG